MVKPNGKCRGNTPEKGLELQQHNTNALTQFKHQQNEGVQITEQYITDLKRAQQNAHDWSITQVLFGSR
ncbi:hypothetical protein J4727_04855 [Providencia rettgeri]|uniref:Uncharacterized protein n=1 Tax=Providencia rettgeri TaxID=587 RepID=A0A939SLC8_PRORE|nr:hypothetical protein [Providencia rettgeri]